MDILEGDEVGAIVGIVDHKSAQLPGSMPGLEVGLEVNAYPGSFFSGACVRLSPRLRPSGCSIPP